MKLSQTIVSTLLETDFSSYVDVAVASDMHSWASEDNGTYMQWFQPVRGYTATILVYTPHTTYNRIHIYVSKGGEDRDTLFLRSRKTYAEVSTRLYRISKGITELAKKWEADKSKPFSSEAFLDQIYDSLQKDSTWDQVWKDYAC